MKRKIMIAVLIFILIVIVAIGIEGAMDRFYYSKPFNGQTACMIKCAEIIPAENAPEMSELEKSCYYGFLNGKKKNTPDNWIHMYGKTKNSEWCAPMRNNIERCDCDKSD